MSPTKEQQFWHWFQENEDAIFAFDENQEAVFDAISDAMDAYQKGLVFEISHIHDGKRDFVISADGVTEYFPAVTALVESAPELERWSITPFRPRMYGYDQLNLKYADKVFHPSDMWIYYRVDEGHFDIIIYHHEFTEEERDIFVTASFILLDMALGEYDVATGIRYIDHQKTPEQPEEVGLKRFSELRMIFDVAKNRVN